jgi:hypothetical protein
MSANFSFQENLESFIGDKADKEYWLKISSKDTQSISPFDFTVKFDMNIKQIDRDLSGNLINNSFRKEAVIYDKYKDIKRLEVTDVIIPRFIPTTTIGLPFDGVAFVQDFTDPKIYYASCYPGIIQKTGTFMVNASPIGYIKFTNPKDTIVLTGVDYSEAFASDSGGFRFKDNRIIDHITIDNIPYPIEYVDNNKIKLLTDFDNILPAQIKMISGNYYSNILYSINYIDDFIESDDTTVTLKNLSAQLFENFYSSNIIRFHSYRFNGSNVKVQDNFYFKITRIDQVDADVVLTGNFIGDTLPDISLVIGGTTLELYSFGFGTRDLLDDRIFYMEMDPFVPVKSSATDNQLDKMFGVLFPSTQSKDWLYLSGEPKESFLPRDLRKLDKITIRLYDSEGVALNDLFKNRPGLLNGNYFKSMYTTIVIKVDESGKALIVKK